MAMIIELDTGLFPDGETLSAATDQLVEAPGVTRLDLTKLAKDDRQGWLAVARAILDSTLVITR